METKIRPRHPEKVNKPINPIKKKPSWIRSKITNSKEFFLTKTIVNQNNLVTVCQEANCPNITECWSKRHATFMIMGDTCTRGCAFCDVKTGKPNRLDPLEPLKIAKAVKDDEVIAEAVEDFVEAAIENADTALQPYTLADVVVEKQFEKLRSEGLGAIIDTDLSKIEISKIGADMTQDQREKAQEVIVPTILVRLASIALLRKTI